eukprot:405718-Rhodomonas_salina.1
MRRCMQDNLRGLCASSSVCVSVRLPHQNKNRGSTHNSLSASFSLISKIIAMWGRRATPTVGGEVVGRRRRIAPGLVVR